MTSFHTHTGNPNTHSPAWNVCTNRFLQSTASRSFPRVLLLGLWPAQQQVEELAPFRLSGRAVPLSSNQRAPNPSPLPGVSRRRMIYFLRGRPRVRARHHRQQHTETQLGWWRAGNLFVPRGQATGDRRREDSSRIGGESARQCSQRQQQAATKSRSGFWHHPETKTNTQQKQPLSRSLPTGSQQHAGC